MLKAIGGVTGQKYNLGPAPAGDAKKKRIWLGITALPTGKMPPPSRKIPPQNLGPHLKNPPS